MEGSRRIDLSKLLGFEAISDEISGNVDFKDAALDAQLGAKVGTEAWIEPDLASEFPAEGPKPAGPRGLQPR